MNRLALLTILAAALAASPAPAATYDLRAGATTLSLPGRAAPVPAWGFADDTGRAPGSGAVQVPGPTLRAAIGETLTVNLTNTLLVPVSLIIPGQAFQPPAAPINEGGRVRSFVAEVAPGATGRFTFPAARAGAFLYQSGTNPGVQLPMGLYGALVVGPAPAGMTSETLVFGEIDPEVNDAVAAAPTAPHSTSRYRPAFFLVNGRVYPDQAPLGLVAGNDAYVRLLNAGALLHMPFASGLTFTVVRDDGEDVAHPYDADVVRLPPGKVLETIVRPPAPGRYVLLDRRALPNTGPTGHGGATLIVEAAAANAPPTVQAGPDLTAPISAGSIALQGAAADADGPKPLATAWRLLSGPAPLSFSDAASPTATATFTQEGGYTLELSATDGLSTITDTMTLTVTAEAPPAPPTGVVARRLRTNRVYVTWTDASSNETGFVVERRDAIDRQPGVWVVLATVPANSTGFVDPDAPRGDATKQWQYQVKARNEAGTSAPALSGWIR